MSHVTDPECSTTVRFSTADLPENLRVATWREHYSHTVLRADIDPGDDASFDATVVSRSLPGLQLVSGRFTAARIVRTREMIADGNDDLSLLVNQTGIVTVSARGREVTLRENDAVLISSSEAVVFDRRSFGESIAIRIPYSILSPAVVDVDDAIMPRCDPHARSDRACARSYPRSRGRCRKSGVGVCPTESSKDLYCRKPPPSGYFDRHRRRACRHDAAPSAATV